MEKLLCAHTCPSCGQYCTCQGDWDDIDMGEWSECEHCPSEFDEDNEEDEDEDYYIEDPSEDPERNPLL